MVRSSQEQVAGNWGYRFYVVQRHTDSKCVRVVETQGETLLNTGYTADDPTGDWDLRVEDDITNEVQLYLDGKYRPAWLSRSDVEGQAPKKLVLVPAADDHR